MHSLERQPRPTESEVLGGVGPRSQRADRFSGWLMCARVCVPQKQEGWLWVLVCLASPDGSAGKESVCNAGDTGNTGSIPGSGGSPGGGNGTPLQNSCLQNPTDRGAWWDTVQRVPKSWARLKWLRCPLSAVLDQTLDVLWQREQLSSSLSQRQKRRTQDSLKKLLVYILRSRGLRNLLNHLLFKESIVEQGKAYHKMTWGYGPLRLRDLGLNLWLLLLPFLDPVATVKVQK